MQDTSSTLRPTKTSPLPGRVVLVMQGGGAPGCYQAGAYQALHEAGIEPDWIIGTSIGAINGAIIAGNDGPGRVEKLREFWNQLDSGLPACPDFISSIRRLPGVSIPASASTGRLCIWSIR
jgi:predicted acylesterase/phospholipase RssA